MRLHSLAEFWFRGLLSAFVGHPPGTYWTAVTLWQLSGCFDKPPPAVLPYV